MKSKLLNNYPVKKEKISVQKREKNRIRKYVRFIKTNHDWDYEYIIQLLRFKLKMVRETIQQHDIIVQEELDQISEQIIEVEKLLDRIIEDNYFYELKAYFEKKYGKVEHNFISKKETDLSTFKTTYHVSDDKLEEAKQEYLKLHNLSFEMRKNDLKKAFELISENIWNWWD
jgi:hypothetical protein